MNGKLTNFFGQDVRSIVDSQAIKRAAENIKEVMRQKHNSFFYVHVSCFLVYFYFLPSRTISIIKWYILCSSVEQIKVSELEANPLSRLAQELITAFYILRVRSFEISFSINSE